MVEPCGGVYVGVGCTTFTPGEEMVGRGMSRLICCWCGCTWYAIARIGWEVLPFRSGLGIHVLLKGSVADRGVLYLGNKFRCIDTPFKYELMYS